MKVCILGKLGRMGSFLNYVLENRVNYEVVSGIDIKNDYSKTLVFNNVEEAYNSEPFDILIDFSVSDISFKSIEYCLKNNIKVLSGTTNIKPNKMKYLKELSITNKTSFIWTPNFALGAAILYDLSRRINSYFTSYDIIESHNINKLDSPSGTAKEYADLLDVREDKIQSIRLNDVITSHDVIFNNKGEKLIIRHEVYHRDAFLKGFLKSLDKLENNNISIVGLKEYYDFMTK